MPVNTSEPSQLLEISSLQTHIPTRYGVVKAVDGVSMKVGARTIVGLVGESGSGKTMLAQSVMQIQPWPARIVSGRVMLNGSSGVGVELTAHAPTSETLRRIRGNRIAYIHQEPGAALSPVHTIGNQIQEAVRVHNRNIHPDELRRRCIDMLERVGIAGAASRLDAYTFQFSGGMRQRVMIAMALVNHPEMLIADEPTTALDVTVQAQILALFRDLQREMEMSVLFVTHNLGVLAEVADEVVVMYLGKIVERASIMDLFDRPLHPYTSALLQAMPSSQHGRGRLPSVRGSVPDPQSRPSGCPFRDRCDVVIPDRCATSCPDLTEVSVGHWVRCFHHSDAVEAKVQVTVGGRNLHHV